MHSYPTRGAALVAMLGLAGALIAVIPGDADDAESKVELKWSVCPADALIPKGVSAQCATVPVPLEYYDPGSKQIELMIPKVASTNQRSGAAC